MRKSNNYYKFLNYVSVGSWYTSTICKDNGVLECKSYSRVSYIESYSKLYHCAYEKTIFNSDVELAFENVLVNNEVIYIYYLVDVGRIFIDAFLLDNYKTQKELKDEIHKRVVEFFLNDESFCEHEEATEDSAEHKEISDVEKVCGDCSHFNACMQGYQTIATSCCMFDSLHKAKKNPAWHHVSLSTLTNLDFDMLDEKRRLYLSLYREVKELIHDLRKCKSCHSYEKRLAKIYSINADLVDENKVTSDYIRYVTRKISMCNVECGVWASANEESTGYHKSRRYNQLTMRY